MDEKENIVNIIDRIWGEQADLKSEYKIMIYKTIQLLNEKLNERINNAINTNKRKQNFVTPKINKLYSCENRKNLLIKIKQLMKELGEEIDVTSERNTDYEKELVFVKDDLEQYAKQILFELQMDSNFKIDDGKISQKTQYNQEQLAEYYNLLQEAYEKYVRCVNDNDMFAAFPSDSEFGNVGICGNDFIDEDECCEDEPIEEFDFNNELEELKKSLQIKYYGVLDEDVLPHVNAFWRGICALSKFIENNNNEVVCVPQTIFDEKTMFAIRRKINNANFVVTEEKILKMHNLMNDIEKGEK